MSNFYILDEERKVVPCDLMTWVRYFGSNSRRIGWTRVLDKASVSTIFQGNDFQTGPGGPPLIFETVVFGGHLNREMNRYSTWDEAVAGHEAMVARVQKRESNT